jgi:large subunit ribosomal protein L23
MRTPDLSPYHAKFRVPLNFSKYDLRDYLYHAYNVKVHSIRSLVRQMPVRDTVAQPRHWFRPESEKYMTVEMEKPFVWPEAPESWEPWGRKERDASVLSSRAFQGVQSPRDQRVDARTLRHQALSLLNTEPDAAVKKWEKRRTPQMLSHEQLPSSNFANLRLPKATEPTKPSKPASQ